MGNRDLLSPCNKCGQMKFATIDNIDEFRADLLRKYE